MIKNEYTFWFLLKQLKIVQYPVTKDEFFTITNLKSC